MDRAGWKTTEFWVTAMVVAGGLFEGLGGRSDNAEWAAVCASLAAAAYAISRAIAKRAPAPGAVVAGHTATVTTTTEQAPAEPPPASGVPPAVAGT